jgi:hypothetical protein
MTESTIFNIPDSYFEERAAICKWIRPSNKATMTSFLTSLSERYKSTFVALEGVLETSFILLQEGNNLTFTYFTKVRSNLSKVDLISELVSYAVKKIPNFESLTISIPILFENNVTLSEKFSFNIENQNWLIRIPKPTLQERNVSLCVLSEQNLSDYKSKYEEICKKHPTYTAPSAATLLMELRNSRENRHRAILLRNGSPVGISTFQYLADSGTVIDFYGFAEFNSQNTRTLYSLIAEHTEASHLCGVKQPRHIAHLKRVLPECQHELVFSHTRACVRLVNSK